MNKTILTLIIAAFVFGGCFSRKIALGTSDVERMQGKYPGYTLEEMQQGKMLFDTHCTMCHAAKEPKAYTEEAWSKLVPGMSKKVNEKKPNTLDADDEALIMKYVMTMKSRP